MFRCVLRGLLTPGAIARATACAAILVLACGAGEAAPKRPPSPDPGGPPFNAPIAVGGPTVSVDAKKPGRLVRLRFHAKAGQRLGLGISEIRLSPESASALVVTVRGPNDELLPTGRIHCFAVSASRPQGSCDGEFTVRQAGWNVVEVDTPFSATAKFNASLSRPVTATLAPDREETAKLERTGQDARFEIAADAGSDILINARDATPGRSEGAFTLRIFRPDGTLLSETRGTVLRGASIPLKGEGGTYVVEVDPAHGAQGVYAVSAKAARQLALDGSPMQFATATSSEVLRFGFAANAGQSAAVAVEGLVHSPDVDSNSRVSVLKADGTRLAFASCWTHAVYGMQPGPCKVLVANLPESGRYTVEVSPPVRATVSGRLVATETVSGTIAPGTPVTLGAMKPGQIARYSFAGSAGQIVGVQLANFSCSPAATMVNVSLRPERGTGMVALRSGREGTVSIPPTVLRTDGTFVVEVDPGLGSVQSGELSLTIEEGKPQ